MLIYTSSCHAESWLGKITVLCCRTLVCVKSQSVLPPASEQLLLGNILEELKVSLQSCS